MIEKIDFFISPAYSVPPIRTMRFSIDTIMNVSEFVPSIAGFALNEGAETIVNCASCIHSSSSVGRMNKL